MLVTKRLVGVKAKMLMLLVLAVLVTVTQVTFSGSARADGIVGGCTGSIHGLLTQDICVHAMMGGKNYTNHTQWVGTVEAAQPNDGPVGFLEVWGDGFYHSGRGVSLTWTINKWVASGTNICAAETDNYGVREIACIHISV